MKNSCNYIILCFCLLISVNLLAQTKSKNKLSNDKKTKVIYQLPTMQVMKMTMASPRKIMIGHKKMVWLFNSSTKNGYWAGLKVNEKEKFEQLLKQGDTLYSVSFYDYKKTYHEASRFSSTIPKKAFEVNKFEEHPEWITKKGSLVKADGSSRFELKGAIGKTNIYYFKNVKLLGMYLAGYNKYNFPETNKANTDHIIVADTLFVSPTSFGFLNIQRRNRGYIKVIANCIIYERPIKVSSTENITDFVFSAKEIFLKTPYKDLTKTELNSPLPFIWKVDKNVESYIDPFAENEALLINRLMINIMIQISTDLQNSNDDYWAKDKLLEKFQSFRGRVNSNVLVVDSEYLNRFKDLCNEFDNKYVKEIINTKRTIGDLTILVEGEIGDLPKVPFKYYAIPSNATLLPVKDHTTGIQDKLGDLYYKATGDSKMSLTLQVKLGYDAIKFDEANQILKEKGLVLESNPPQTVMSISEQPLKAKGRTIGRIVPISNQILRFEIDLPEEGLDIIKLFLKDDNIFDLDYKVYQVQKEGNQKITLEIPKEILQELDFTDLINEFNTVQSNTITDAVYITSNLSPFLEDSGEGVFEYIKISLEFLFDDKKVFLGPERFSSHSVNGSEKMINFVKFSDNYKIIVTGTAYYEFGQRDIVKENIFTNTDKIITLQESMFKDISSKN